MNFNQHLANYEFLLVRRTDKNPVDAFDENGFLRSDALIDELRDVPEMSMNLLGGLFELQHIKFIPKQEASKKWTTPHKIKFRDYKNSFRVLNESYPIYFLFNDIHNQVIPYQRNSNDPKVQKLYKKLKIPLTSNSLVDFEGKTVVSHEPINLNYWHIEFLLSDPKEEQEVKRKNIKSDDDGYWQNNLARTALNNILLVNARRDVTTIKYNKVPINMYKN
jgi:hypothetical protein